MSTILTGTITMLTIGIGSLPARASSLKVRQIKFFGSAGLWHRGQRRFNE
jgi:hypothetical protein